MPIIPNEPPIPLSYLLGRIRDIRERLCDSKGEEQQRLLSQYTEELAPYVIRLGFYLILVIEKKGDLSRLQELRFPEDVIFPLPEDECGG